MQLLVIKTVLVATDLDASSMPAIAAGESLAAAADAELHVVHVSPTGSPHSGAVHQMLERAGVPLDAASVHAVAGDPALAISRLADALSADVIVLGPHHHPSDGRGVMSDTALGVVTQTAAPCLVAHELRLPLTHTVVAVDLSETSRGALVVGLSWASALRATRMRGESAATLTALYVTKQDSGADDLLAMRAALERQVDDLRDDAGSWANVAIDCQVIAAPNPADAVVGYASERAAGLIVLGTRGLGLDTVGRLGSVAGAIAEATTIPTLLVPPAIWLELGRVRPRRRRYSPLKARASR